MQERPSLLAAASGISRATALIFAREGANVVCADINEKGADETAAEVNRKGSRALAIKVDVTKRTEVDDMVECAIAAFGGVQFLFNSAGAAIRPAKFLEIDDTLMEKSFALNVNGTMQRFGQPEEIGELVLFICSDACEFMTADTIYVNGGGGWR